MAKLTLIVGINGHDTVVKTSKASPARGRMSTSRTWVDVSPSADLTTRLRSGLEIGARAEIRVPVTSRNSDAFRYARRSEVSRGLRRLLMKAENPVTALATNGPSQRMTSNRQRQFQHIPLAAMWTAKDN